MKNTLFCLLAFIASITNASAEVKVGVILPLSGDFGYFGEEVRQGMSVAIDELRSSDAQAPQLIFEDDKCLAKVAVSAFRKLTSEQKVALVVGPACSTSIQSVAPIASRLSTPVMFLLDTGDSVSLLPDPLYSFGFDPPKMARTLADDLHDRKLKVVATVTEEEEYAVLITKAFTEKWKTLGGTIVSAESIPVNGTDLRSSITRVLSNHPEAIFYSAAYQSGTFLKQLRSLDSNIPVYGNDTMCVAETIDIAGSAANGARCGNVLLDESSPEAQAFRKAIVTKFNKAPSSLFYEALGYDSVRYILEELKLKPMPGKPLLGVTKRALNGVYDVIPSILEIKEGKMVPVSNFH